MDAALVHEVDDHLHLVIALEVSKLGRIACIGQGLKAGLHQLDQTAAKNSLLAEEVFLGLLGEGALHDAGAAAADSPSVRSGDIPSVARGVLVHAAQIGHARTLGVLTADDVAGALGGNHDDVDAFRRALM